MKSVVFEEDLSITFMDREKPAPGSGQVLLKVHLCGICGTDLHAPLIGDLFQKPVILGHEFSGTVEDVGAGVEGVEAGEEVVVNPMATHCGKCAACRAGQFHICEVTLSQGTLGIGLNGGMAEYALVQPVHLHRLPAGLSLDAAAWAEPLAVAVRGVGRGDVGLGDSVAIYGAGPIGQLALQAARAAGAGETLVVESSQFRRDVAARCGADVVAGPAEAAEIEKRYDVVIDCTGAPAAFDAVVARVDFGGRVVVVGTHTGPATISEPIVPHLKETPISWSLCYRDQFEFAAAVEMLGKGTVDTAPLTSGTTGLDGVDEAFEAMRDPESALKIMLSPTA
jgi:threonine dehydrogenase-like Zn-dependent dehydrogenase